MNSVFSGQTEHFSPSNIGSSSSQPEKFAENWTFEENKVFEIALANLPGQNMSSVDLLHRIDEIKVPGKTTEQIRKHLEMLIEDGNFIETYDGPIYYGNGAADLGVGRQNAATKSPKVCPNSPKKKVARWSQDEHGKFLLGLAVYGKGDWKSISRHVVLTRSPTQVASHAQKYFIRLAREKTASQTTVPPKSAENAFTISPSS